MEDFDLVVDPRESGVVGEFESEWAGGEPELDRDDVPVFDRGRSDVLSVEELFDNPEEF